MVVLVDLVVEEVAQDSVSPERLEAQFLVVEEPEVLAAVPEVPARLTIAVAVVVVVLG